MRVHYLIIVLIAGLSISAAGQEMVSYATADSNSYALYQQGDWKTLLRYGKEVIRSGQDFPLLRMRMGYAAFMAGDYSGAITQYEKVLKEDAYNSTAHYFIYWSRINLSQPEQAHASLSFISASDIPAAHFKSSAFESAGFELSSKSNSITDRGSALYWLAKTGYRFSHAIHMETAFAGFNQQLNEPGLTNVTNNDKVKINQFEVYNKMTANLSRQWQLKLAWHYLRTPFNNFSYNNNLVLAGLNWNGSYVSVQADAVFGYITDTSSSQLNLQLRLYPAGNTNLYSFSTGTVLNRETSSFIFRQVLGARLAGNVWLEGHYTGGPFRNLAENDALYLFNAIDPDKFKTGATLYLMHKSLLLQLGYTYEQKERFATGILFNQHSITGGLSWKF